MIVHPDACPFLQGEIVPKLDRQPHSLDWVPR